MFWRDNLVSSETIGSLFVVLIAVLRQLFQLKTNNSRRNISIGQVYVALIQATCLNHWNESAMHRKIHLKNSSFNWQVTNDFWLQKSAILITCPGTRILSPNPQTLVMECVLSFLFSRLLPLPTTTTWVGIFVMGFSEAALSDLRSDEERVKKQGFNPSPSLALLNKYLFWRSLFGEVGFLRCSCSINQYVVTCPFPFMCTSPLRLIVNPPRISRMFFVASLICIIPASPLDSILDAVFTVSPKRQ